MRSTGTCTESPQVSDDQLKLDQTLKRLRKLRWIGKEREAQKIFRSLGDIRVPSSVPADWSHLNWIDQLILEEILHVASPANRRV
jgi:hypothetical protein